MSDVTDLKAISATERLRRLLDECGVEWDYGITGSTTTRFSVNGIDLTFTPMRDGLVCSTILTPEQAIAATLGSCNCSNDCTDSERTGTCEADETDTIKCWVKCKDEPSSERMELIHVMECSECGHTYEHVNGGYEFCPRCGRKVVDDG